MIIAIDGTASSGKSSLSKAMAKKLHIPVIGTGSIYRAIALKLLTFEIDDFDDVKIKSVLDSTIIEVKFEDYSPYIVLDGIRQNPSKLSSHSVSVFTPKIANKPFVREFVRKIQKKTAKHNKDIIVEGRDIASIVFPNADLKLYVDADLETRAKRRQQDYISQGKNFSYEEVVAEIQARDEEDMNRSSSPLIMTSDSVLIDTTDTSLEECVDNVIRLYNEKR